MSRYLRAYKAFPLLYFARGRNLPTDAVVLCQGLLRRLDSSEYLKAGVSVTGPRRSFDFTLGAQLEKGLLFCENLDFGITFVYMDAPESCFVSALRGKNRPPSLVPPLSSLYWVVVVPA